LKKYIYEDLVQDDRCANDSRTITSGKIKYLKDGKTIKLIDFGNGECDTKITVTDCTDGKCNEINAIEKDVDFSIDFINGNVTEQEKVFLSL
jgi:hypothetical protein